MKIVSRALVVLIVLAGLHSCKEKTTIDVSQIKAPVEIVRIDELLPTIKTKEQLLELISQNKAFMDIYLAQVLNITSTSPDSIFSQVQYFNKDSLHLAIQKHIAKDINNEKEIDEQVKDLYKRIKYYFPSKNLSPKIYTYSADYAIQMFTFLDEKNNDAIAVGLDMFLYPSVDYKRLNPDNTNFSDYITRSWNKEHITKKVAEVFTKEIIGDPAGFKLMDLMIHNGKELYIMDQLLPNVHDSIIHEYAAKQLKWCEDNVQGMWSHFIDKKLFYEATPAKINRYVSPSPFSPDMPSEAPGRTANYIGYQIVKAYMDRFPKTTMEELIQMKDAQQILDKSKYKPKR
jgi:hypothetical protein